MIVVSSFRGRAMVKRKNGAARLLVFFLFLFMHLADARAALRLIVILLYVKCLMPLSRGRTRPRRTQALRLCDSRQSGDIKRPHRSVRHGVVCDVFVFSFYSVVKGRHANTLARRGTVCGLLRRIQMTKRSGGCDDGSRPPAC